MLALVFHIDLVCLKNVMINSIQDFGQVHEYRAYIHVWIWFT